MQPDSKSRIRAQLAMMRVKRAKEEATPMGADAVEIQRILHAKRYLHARKKHLSNRHYRAKGRVVEWYETDDEW